MINRHPRGAFVASKIVFHAALQFAWHHAEPVRKDLYYCGRGLVQLAFDIKNAM